MGARGIKFRSPTSTSATNYHIKPARSPNDKYHKHGTCRTGLKEDEADLDIAMSGTSLTVQDSKLRLPGKEEKTIFNIFH